MHLKPDKRRVIKLNQCREDPKNEMRVAGSAVSRSSRRFRGKTVLLLGRPDSKEKMWAFIRCFG